MTTKSFIEGNRKFSTLSWISRVRLEESRLWHLKHDCGMHGCYKIQYRPRVINREAILRVHNYALIEHEYRRIVENDDGLPTKKEVE